MYVRLPLVGLLLAGLMGPAARADVQPHPLFCENLVLQQGTAVPVWGTADPGEKVSVRCQGQEVSVVADKDGQWLVRLQDLKPGGPYELTITGKNSIRLENVLVGEVWLCSGQSNMEWSVKASADADKNIAASANDRIRLFTVPRTKAETPQTHLKGNWSVCGPATVAGFSAVGYYFGRDLQKALNVPVGLIHSSWGGTAAELWTSRRVLDSNPNFPKNGGQLYNGMIAPLIPYAIKGVIWYQGESNAGRAWQYRSLFPAMIQNWRDDWKQGDFPFLYVQLAPFMKIVNEPSESAWAELREAQLLTLKQPNTAMAVITDLGDEKDIHPRRKEPVGQRLALAALGRVYGRKIVYSGPIYESMKVEGNQAILRFQHTGSGLIVKGDRLTGFTIAGEDRKFVNADAVIVEDRVVVSSPSVSRPVAVRFGWANYPLVNLYNKEGLPASPFRTDDFPLLTAPKKP